MTTNTMTHDMERPKDPVDLSREHVEREVHEELKRIQAQANKVDAVAIGECLNCGQDFKPGDRRRWCNDVCRDEWQEIRDHKKKHHARRGNHR